MTWRMLLIGLLASVAATSAAGSQRTVKSDQDVLIELERGWDAAFHRNDVKFIERILADEFIATYGDGTRGDKAKELQIAATFNAQVDSSSLDDFTIKIYRDTAVVWFTQRMTGPVKGKPVEIVSRYIDVFVMRDGRWQCVASQSTRMGAPRD